MKNTIDSEISGYYPLGLRVGESERLRIQAEAMAPDAAVMLDRIEVGDGWRCLDLGCGGGGITDLLAPRVLPSGNVVGVDANPRILEIARAWAAEKGLEGTEFVLGDAVATGLPAGSFDFVHTRFVLSTTGLAVEILQEAVRLTRCGGVVAIEEPDMDGLNCYPENDAFSHLKEILTDGFAAAGADLRLGKRAYRLMRAQGLTDLQYRPCTVGIRSFDAMVDYLPQTVESIRPTILENKLAKPEQLDRLIAECRIHLRDPDTVFTTYLVAQVWGRKGGPETQSS